MNLRRISYALGSAVAAVVMLAVYAAALLFAPFQLGRLLRAVSIPRMREHRLRTTLTTLGVALGVAVMVAVVIVGRSIVLGVTQTVDDLAGKADLQVGSGSNGFEESMLDRVRAVPGVYKITPVLQQLASLRTRSGQRERLLVLGVDLLGSEDKYFRSYASSELNEIRRDPLSFLNSSTNLILSRRLADRLGLRLHDKVALGTSLGVQDCEVWGFIENEGVGRAFGGAIAIMYYPAVQVAFERGRNIDRIDIAVTPGTNPEIVAKAIEAELGPGVPVERPSLRGERVSKMLKSVQIGLSSSSLVALIAGAFLVFNAISISIVQRKHEISCLRALGTTRKQLVSLLTLEGALLGAVGSGLGIGIGIAISSGMLRTTSEAVNRVYMQQAVADVQIDYRLVLLALLLGIGSAIVAALMAARGANLAPSSARNPLAQPGLESARGHVGRTDWIGFGLLAVSCVLMLLPPIGIMPVGPLASFVTLTLAGGALMPQLVRRVHAVLGPLMQRFFGVEASLANNNLPRDLSRTASMASGLMASTALTVSSAAFTVSLIMSLETWSAQSAPGDLFVTSGTAMAGASGSNTPLTDALGPELMAVPGVAQIRRTRCVDVDFRKSPAKLISTDIGVFLQRSHASLIEGSSQQIGRDLLGGGVAVSENFSRVHGVHRGDRIALSASNGTREFDVVAVVIDYTSDIGTILMDRATYLSTWNDSRVDTYELHLQRSADPMAVRQIIDQRLSERYDLFVLTNREYRDEFVKAANSVLSLMRVLELVTLLVAVLGMITATLANVLDRVREIGMLRAVGMLRAQVRRMIVIESMFVGSIGMCAGFALGTFGGYVLMRRVINVEVGWYLPFRLPVRSLIEVALVTLPISALAGFYPARQAAKLVVSDALDYE